MGVTFDVSYICLAGMIISMNWRNNETQLLYRDKHFQISDSLSKCIFFLILVFGFILNLFFFLSISECVLFRNNVPRDPR